MPFTLQDYIAIGFTAGLTIIYVPQYYKIIKMKSSIGFHPWYLFLGYMASTISVINAIIYYWDSLRAGVSWIPYLQSISGFALLLFQWFLFLVFYIIFIKYYSVEESHESGQDSKGHNKTYINRNQNIVHNAEGLDVAVAVSIRPDVPDLSIRLDVPNQQISIPDTENDVKQDIAEIFASDDASPTQNDPSILASSHNPTSRDPSRDLSNRDIHARPMLDVNYEGISIQPSVVPPVYIGGKSRSSIGNITGRQLLGRNMRNSKGESMVSKLATLPTWINRKLITVRTKTSNNVIFLISHIRTAISLSITLILLYNPLISIIHLSDWSNTMEISTLVMFTLHYLPQIWETYKLKKVGSLSLVTLSMMCPGTFVWTYFLASQNNSNISIWLPYLCVGIMQLILIIIGVYYEIRDRIKRRRNPLLENL